VRVLIQYQKRTLRLAMNQSTNLAEIEQSFARLKKELQDYRREISDGSSKIFEAFGRVKTEPAAFSIFPSDIQSERQITIERERVPYELGRNSRCVNDPPSKTGKRQRNRRGNECLSCGRNGPEKHANGLCFAIWTSRSARPAQSTGPGAIHAPTIKNHTDFSQHKLH
jgi:hypothetical protein